MGAGVSEEKWAVEISGLYNGDRIIIKSIG